MTLLGLSFLDGRRIKDNSKIIPINAFSCICAGILIYTSWFAFNFQIKRKTIIIIKMIQATQ